MAGPHAKSITIEALCLCAWAANSFMTARENNSENSIDNIISTALIATDVAFIGGGESCQGGHMRMPFELELIEME